jgi:tetratricopeptide (TPR) repeat protein
MKWSQNYCLSIDMIASTPRWRNKPTSTLDRLNTAFSKQIALYLDKLELRDLLIKYGGDGWLLIAQGMDKLPNLICLALIMSHRFQHDMHDQLHDLPSTAIPSLRLAICCGRDVRVTLPDGTGDWAGQSARRAVRAASLCYDNEILVEGAVRRDYNNDFIFKRIHKTKRPRTKAAFEYDFTLYACQGLKTAAANDAGAPGCYIHTFLIIGEKSAALSLAEKRTTRLAKKATAHQAETGSAEEINKTVSDTTKLVLNTASTSYATAYAAVGALEGAGLTPKTTAYNNLIKHAPSYKKACSLLQWMKAEGPSPNATTYNTLIDRAPDCQTARGWLKRMKDEDIRPDVVTYNTLIKMAPNYRAARSWLKRMKDEDIRPNVVTYSTLIKLAPNCRAARGWLKRMKDEDIRPNVVTYSTLIKLAPSYRAARGWLKRMKDEDIQPNVVTYNTLINLAPNYRAARGWLKRMKDEDIRPNVVTYSTLIDKAPDYETGKDLIEEMKMEDLQADRFAFTSLFSKDLSRQEPEAILSWYFSREYYPGLLPIEVAIASYRKKKRVNQALRLALNYPYLPASRKLIQQHTDAAISFFSSVYEENRQDRNATYALGMTFIYLNDWRKAIIYLRQAHQLATAEGRKIHIAQLLKRISGEGPSHDE